MAFLGSPNGASSPSSDATPRDLYLPATRLLAGGKVVAFYEARKPRWTLKSLVSGLSPVVIASTKEGTIRLRLLETSDFAIIVGESAAGALTEMSRVDLVAGAPSAAVSVAVPKNASFTLGSLDDESLSQRRSRWWAVGGAADAPLRWLLKDSSQSLAIDVGDESLLAVVSIGTTDLVVSKNSDGVVTGRTLQAPASTVALGNVGACSTPALWTREASDGHRSLVGLVGCDGKNLDVYRVDMAPRVSSSVCTACNGLLSPGARDTSPDLSFLAVPEAECTSIRSVEDDTKRWATATGAVVALAVKSQPGAAQEPQRPWVSPSNAALYSTERPPIQAGSCSAYVATIPVVPSNALFSCPLQ
jgi:hypothetical protein